MSRSVGDYRPRDAEHAVLYRVLDEHLDAFLGTTRRPADGVPLPAFVEQEFRDFLTCGILAHGFARLRCTECALERLVPFSCKGRGFCPSCGGRRMTESAARLVDGVLPRVPVRQWVLSLPYRLRYLLAWDHGLARAVLAVSVRVLLGFQRHRARRYGIRAGRSGSVTVIQRFGGGLNLNVHFHTLLLDGVFFEGQEGALEFRPLPPPTDDEVGGVLARIAARVQRLLRRRGRDPWEADGVQADPLVDESPTLAGISSASVQGRIALGPRAGARVWRLGDDPDAPWVLSTMPRHAHLAGFDLHANVAVPATDRARLEQLCRYLLRPAVAQDRLRQLDDGRVVLTLKSPWADGTRQLLFEPLTLLEKLAALIPWPRTNLVVYHGVLAPHSGWRARVVAYGTPPAVASPCSEASDTSKSAPRHWAWAALMRRAFGLDVLACPRCGGRLRLIATVEDPEAIRAILAALAASREREGRAPPGAGGEPPSPRGCSAPERTPRSPKSVRRRLGAGHPSGQAPCSSRESRDTLVVRAVPGGRSGGGGGVLLTALDPARGGRFWPLLRPWLFLGAFGAVLVGALLFDSRLEYDPDVPPVRYGLHFAALMTGTTCVAAAWWARKRNQTWDSDVIPALLGGLGALVIAVSLHGTPFSLDGLHGDQAFRTAAITRFADSAALSDYTYRDLPAFYAPLFFWVLGRASVLLGVEPWRMLKLGTIAAAFIAPMVAYLCWRRLVPARIAALIAFVPFVVRGYGEPYGWLVRAVIIPWWLEAVHGMVREDLRPRHPIVLGLIGALLFATYYYYFFIFVIAYPLYLVIEGMRGDVDWRAVRRGLGILGITAIATAIYWAPLAWTMLTGPVATVSNRWLTMRHGEVRLPMIEPTVIGALCLLGVVFLAWTWREPLSRALAVITISLYVWHAIGFPLIMIDRPVLSFRMRELVPVVLLSAGAIALPRVVAFAESMVRDVRVARVSAILAVVLAVALTTGHVRETVADPQFANARKTARPHEARDESVSAEQVKSTIDAFYRGNEPPVVLSARTDVMALYPYYGFIQWVAYYSHPSAQYSERLAFLLELARSRSAQEFAERAGRNAFDAIDAFVLRVEGDELVYSTWVDNFPRRWSKQVDVRFPASLLDPRHFHLSRLDGYVVAVANRR